MNTNKLYLVTKNDKQYASWAKQMGNKLGKNTLLFDHFQSQVGEMRYANELAKASFICYWEIQTSNSLARLAPAITQATLIQMTHRFLEQEKFEEVEVTPQLISNFLRLLGRLDDEVSEDEEE